MLLPAVFYIIWDSYFTSWAVWSFNETYIMGWYFFGLPLEEILFFFVVPYCCVFIYECIRCYFPSISNEKWALLFFKILAALLLLSTIVFYQRAYTAYTAAFLTIGLLAYLLLRSKVPQLNAAVFLISYSVILIPFLLVNGFLTAIPVVLYNNAENLGVRIYTIPVEDVFYGMLLILLNVILYEFLRSKKPLLK